MNRDIWSTCQGAWDCNRCGGQILPGQKYVKKGNNPRLKHKDLALCIDHLRASLNALAIRMEQQLAKG